MFTIYNILEKKLYPAKSFYFVYTRNLQIYKFYNKCLGFISIWSLSHINS